LPRLKPGPISEAKANAGVLPLHFVQGQDDGQKTSKGRFFRQAQDRLFDCASRDETARSSAQDDSVWVGMTVCGTGGDVHCIAGDLRSIEDYRLRDAGEGRAQG